MELCLDLSKDEVIAKLNFVQGLVDQFEEARLEKETFAVAIVWVGHVVNPAFPPHQHILKQFGVKAPLGSDGSSHENSYAITHLGEPICIAEYATRLAAGPSTHVLQFSDY